MLGGTIVCSVVFRFFLRLYSTRAADVQTSLQVMDTDLQMFFCGTLYPLLLRKTFLETDLMPSSAQADLMSKEYTLVFIFWSQVFCYLQLLCILVTYSEHTLSSLFVQEHRHLSIQEHKLKTYRCTWKSSRVLFSPLRPFF